MGQFTVEEQQRLLTEARLASLTSQIHPHFLFNTLNSVASLIRSDGKMARRVVFKLSVILRRLLRKQDTFSSLQEEAAFIDDYLSIEAVRFGDKLKIVKEFEDQTMRILVPSMLLQPLVENSIKHGLAPKVEGGTIWLSSTLRNGRLQIELSDDGVGIPSEQMHDIFSRGIGLSNVHERLGVLYGSEFHLMLEPRLGGGTRIRIQIPELQYLPTERGSGSSGDRLATIPPDMT